MGENEARGRWGRGGRKERSRTEKTKLRQRGHGRKRAGAKRLRYGAHSAC